MRAAACAGSELQMNKDLKHIGGYPVMTNMMYAVQLKRLEGLGEEPSQEELGGMQWPQRCWWDDRVRIGARKSL